MLASIHSGSATKVWPEILDESEKRQCTLFVFPGGRLSSHDEYEYMRNGIFGLVSAHSFDGAISWASTLSGFASEKQVEDFHVSRIDIPLVTFGLKIADKPVVNIDAYEGMKQLVFHLARRHRCGKIAFIGGPREHSSAEDRFNAYRDALVESGLKYDDNLASLDNSWTEGRRAMLSLLDERKLEPGRDFDAICAASDLLAFEAAKLLQERGFRIPTDIALGGFNDSDESNLFSPTYTTVHVPFERQALQAFHMLLERLDGKRPPDKLLRTKLIVRQSCGCRTESVRLAGMTSCPRLQERSTDDGVAREAAIFRFTAGAAGFKPEDSDRYIKPLISSFATCLSGRSKNLFIDTLDVILNDFIVQDRDIEVFQDILSALWISHREFVGKRASADALELLVSQARVLVSDAEKRIGNYRAWRKRAVDQWFYILNHELLCAKDFESIVTLAAQYLPELNIPSGWFILNGKDQGHRIFIGGFHTEDSRDGSPRVMEPKAGRRTFPSNLILPEELYRGLEGAFIVLPLFDESTALGYMVLRLRRNDAHIFEELRAMFSSAMRGVLLFEQVNETRKRAEKAEKMKTEFLAGISSELQEPLSLIHEAASRLLADAQPAQREEIETIVAYSARQMELTRHLMDLSLAQVDDFALQASLFDPYAFIEDFAARQNAKPAKKKLCTVKLEPLPAALPLALGDVARIRQVVEIFLDCLFRDLGVDEASLSVAASRGGIGLRASGKSGDGDTHREDTGGMSSRSELLGILAASPGLLSLDKLRIEIELAKRIALLHGGSLRGWESGDIFILELRLPYPSMEASGTWEQIPETQGVIGVLGRPQAGFLESEFPGWRQKKISISDAGSANAPSNGISFLCIDPCSMDEEEAAATGILLDNGGFRKTPCFVSASSLEKDQGPTFSSLKAFLSRFVKVQASDTILFLSPGSGSGDETPRLIQALEAGGSRILHCHDPKELEFLAERESPRLLVLAVRSSEFLVAIQSSPNFSALPLLCLAGKFEDAPFEKLLAERPKTILCNSGAVFSDLVASAAARLSRGEEFLPSPTGVIIMKAIIFLNKSFREQVSRWKLSEYLNASEDYLSRIFHRQMGIPLWEYLNRLRIGYAIDLLKGSSDSVAEIASRSGFQDQAYFCRVFRRITGTTPGAVRKESWPDVRKVQ